MVQQRRKGVVYSALLHGLIFLLAVFGLPMLSSPPPSEPVVITVELLPVTGITNVKPAEQPPAPEEKPEPPKEQAKPSPPVKVEKEPPPPPPPPKEKPTEKPKEKVEEKKPEPKPEKKVKPVEEDLEAVLKAVRDTAQQKKESKDEKSEGGAKNKSQSDKYDPTQPMSLSEMDAIMSQIAKCWNVPAGVKNAQDLKIVVYAEFNQDGSFTKVELAQEKARYGSDSAFRSAADAAIRAVKQCSPLQNLPADKYSRWRTLELHFDPKYMLQ